MSEMKTLTLKKICKAESKPQRDYFSNSTVGKGVVHLF